MPQSRSRQASGFNVHQEIGDIIGQSGLGKGAFNKRSLQGPHGATRRAAKLSQWCSPVNE